MLVGSPFFADLTEVEVFEDTTLVSHSNDWIHSAAIADHTMMDDFFVVSSLILEVIDILWLLSDLFTVHQLVKDFTLLLLKFLLDHLLEALSWKSSMILSQFLFNFFFFHSSLLSQSLSLILG